MRGVFSLFVVLCQVVLAAPPSALFSAQRVAEIAELLPEQPTGLGPTGAERERWQKLASTQAAKSMVRKAEGLLSEEPVFMDEEVYLEFSRTGNRSNYQDLVSRRSTRLQTFVFAELVEWQGRFLPAIEAELNRLFDEKSWTLPAHDASLTCFHQTRFHGDLAATELAANLAQIDWWFQDRLSSEIRKRLREECFRRVITPYQEDIRSGTLRNGQWWIHGTNNWNAVCTCNLVRTSLILLQDKQERAEILAAMEHSIPFFLNGFTNDGYCSEGIGYWNYGFGHFTILAETVLAATDGRLDLYEISPKIKAICAYARNIQIDEGVCPAFADCGINGRPSIGILALIQRHLPQTLLKRIPSVTSVFDYAMTPLRMFVDEAPYAVQAPETPVWPPRHLFADAGIYIGRCQDSKKGNFGVAFKAGHNGEQHNHNDVGSFVVVLDKVPFIVDPGNEIYTRRTFSKQRYESQMLNSYGHSVPIVAGKLQSTGRKACGKIVRTDFTEQMDTLVCDMTKAYPEAKELRSLTRTFVFDRANRQITIRDEVEFASPQSFETALVTYQAIRRLDDHAFAVENAKNGLKITIEAEGSAWTTKVGEVIKDDAVNPKRLAIVLEQPIQKGAITITIDELPSLAN